MPPAQASVFTGTIVFATLLMLAYLAAPPGDFAQVGAWYSIIPPVLAVTLAFVTKRLLSSLAFAALIGGMLVTVPSNPLSISNYLQGLSTAFGYGLAALTDSWNLLVLGFVILILSTISVVIVAGGLQGVMQILIRYAKTARSTKLVAALMGLVVFIDDYANTMIVGSSMRPLTDKYNVSREKLAFIVDATSAPVAGLAVVSTWIGYEVGLFGKVSDALEMHIDGYAMFFDALSFRFYCVMMLCFVFISLFMQRDFGAMYRAEHKAATNENTALINLKNTPTVSFNITEPDELAIKKARTALIPFAILLSILLGGIWLDGNGAMLYQQNALAVFTPSSWHQVIIAAKHTTAILVFASALSLITAILCALLIAHINIKTVGKACAVGLKSSLFPVVLLVLAWSLKASGDQLHTGKFLVETIGQVVSPLWFPALLFIAAAVTSFGTGTSWGTMAILIPTAIPVAYQLDGNVYGLITMISLGAVLDGSIFGDHCSPISDTTIMSSIASSCDHLEHVKTQLPYSLFIGVLALVAGYIPAAMGVSPIACLTIAVIITVVFLRFAGKRISADKLVIHSPPA